VNGLTFDEDIPPGAQTIPMGGAESFHSSPEAVKKFNGRDALLRVRDAKPNTDAEHRAPLPDHVYTTKRSFSLLPLTKRIFRVI
jgi:hypothetical protein